jgi:membrane associated rhomboid family serine protease
MATCDQCGKDENMPYNCRHCGGTYCADHRLPENHGCPGLDDWGDPDGVFDSGFDDSVQGQGGSQSITDRLGLNTGVGGPMGYFRGNMTFVFLGLMWITFLLQYVITPLVGIRLFSTTWASLFMLTSENPLYVWTWFTSILSHGGLYHIAVNSIIVYFFGQIVERYVGSRNFTLLFLGSGAAAGLAQVALGIAQGDPTRVLGASGAGLAIMGVLTILNPDMRVYLYFLIPVPIWVITGGYAIVSILPILGGPSLLGANVANAAHLVGLVIGLTYGQRVKRRGVSAPNRMRFGGGGPGGPGGPGRGGGRGPF